MRQIISLALLFWLPNAIISQTAVSGDLNARISSIISGMPGSGDDNYVAPTMDGAK